MAPLRKQAAIATRPVLQAMIDGIRSPYNKPKGGPDVAGRMVALLDAVARALEGVGMTLSTSRRILTARREQDKIDLRIVEQSRRASHPGEQYRLEPTGFLYVTTDDLVPWGKRPGMQRVMWQEESGTSVRDLAKRVVADLPELFAARQRWRVVSEEQGRRRVAEQAEHEKVRRAAAELQARKEQQDTLVDGLMVRATRARELRQYLAEAPAPRDGQEGYGRMLATVAARLAALERDLDPDAIEAAIRAKELFPPPDGEG